VLRNALVGQKILFSTVFTVTTQAGASVPGGGTASIAFLGPNANASRMDATFWIETVQHELDVPSGPAGNKLRITIPAPNANAPTGPTYVGETPHSISAPGTKIIATSTQIQYSQNVFLDFNKLTWPHVSVATLVPQDDQIIPASAWT
jgi:hypothetical protein